MSLSTNKYVILLLMNLVLLVKIGLFLGYHTGLL